MSIPHDTVLIFYFLCTNKNFNNTTKILPPFLNIGLSRDFNKWLHTEQNEWIYTLKYVYIHPYVVVHLKSLKRLIFRNRGSSVLWCIFGIVDINNICVNLIKVSKVWLLKNLHALHYRADGISLSPSQLFDAPLNLIGAPYLSQTLYLPSSHINMSRSRYTYRPIQHSPPLFSLYVTRTPLSTIIPTPS